MPRLPHTPGVIVYSPLASAPVDPDVVLVAGTPGRMMLLQEAALRAQQTTAPLMGRPTCMAVPVSFTSDAVVSSLGCIGNRVYTSLPDDEFYTVISAKALEPIAAQLGTIIAANATLEEYHQGRRATIATT